MLFRIKLKLHLLRFRKKNQFKLLPSREEYLHLLPHKCKQTINRGQIKFQALYLMPKTLYQDKITKNWNNWPNH